MSIYKVTACWYETVTVEADDYDDAVDKAYEELRPMLRVAHGRPDDYDVKMLEDDEND